MALLSSSSMYPLEPLMRTTSASESWQRISSIQQMKMTANKEQCVMTAIVHQRLLRKLLNSVQPHKNKDTEITKGISHTRVVKKSGALLGSKVAGDVGAGLGDSSGRDSFLLAVASAATSVASPGVVFTGVAGSAAASSSAAGSSRTVATGGHVGAAISHGCRSVGGGEESEEPLATDRPFGPPYMGVELVSESLIGPVSDVWDTFV
ncbi:hypothetical protein L596_029533 [Steinernema carpocapsae]|uniref:Uncharacterized protein n=1 Tax=Steinernema carpocapsae TaxID=34508 RepID=A0A4U5LUY3_STECR|nr:hypothetical protein L596_029533 [Steinernema carpocapsae]